MGRGSTIREMLSHTYCQVSHVLNCPCQFLMQVGVDKDDHVLAVAIIDFIRQYTWDKQLETWVKGSGILGGGGKVCEHKPMQTN